ncbi:hypothetical protein SRHO_G00174220 [Serrasalmus rhombeus]
MVFPAVSSTHLPKQQQRRLGLRFICMASQPLSQQAPRLSASIHTELRTKPACHQAVKGPFTCKRHGLVRGRGGGFVSGSGGSGGLLSKEKETERPASSGARSRPGSPSRSHAGPFKANQDRIALR